MLYFPPLVLTLHSVWLNRTQPVKALKETKHNAGSYRLSSREVKCQLRMHHSLALSIRWPVFRCPWTLSSPLPLRMHWLNLIRERVSFTRSERTVCHLKWTHTCIPLAYLWVKPLIHWACYLLKQNKNAVISCWYFVYTSFQRAQGPLEAQWKINGQNNDAVLGWLGSVLCIQCHPEHRLDASPHPHK